MVGPGRYHSGWPIHRSCSRPSGQRRHFSPVVYACWALGCLPCPLDLWWDVLLQEPPGDRLKPLLRGEELDVVRRA